VLGSNPGQTRIRRHSSGGLTALAGEVTKAELLAAGFQAVVEKPILDEHELHDAIDSLLLLAMYEKGEPAPFGETSAA